MPKMPSRLWNTSEKREFAYYFPHVYQAFLLDDEEAKDRIFQQHMDSQEDYDKAVEQLHNLEDCYDELLGVWYYHLSGRPTALRCNGLGCRTS